MNPTNQSSKELLGALLELSPLFKRAFYFSLAVNFLVLAPTVYMLEVYDRVINSRSFETLLMLTVIVLAAYALMEALEWVRRETLSAAGAALDKVLAPRIFSAVFQANLRQMRVGGSAVFNDFRTIREFLSSPALLAFLDAPASIFFIVAIFLINPILGVVTLVVATLQSMLTFLTERTTRASLSEASKRAIQAQNYAAASLRNAEVIAALGMRPQIHDRWMQVQQKHLDLQAEASNRVAGTAAGAKFFQLLQGSLIIGLGTWLFLIGEFPKGGALMMVASIIAARAIAPIGQIIATWKVIIGARQAYQRLDNLLTAIPARTPGMALPAPQGMLTVEGVTAAPLGSNQLLLRGVSFTVPPGNILGIIGPSASGKSTLARLLVGIFPPHGGHVRLDGADVAQWNKSELGPYVGYLPQDVELFDGTIAENIARYGEANQAQVEDAARRAGIEDWITMLDQGYETLIGDAGEALSGGQRQRLAIARAIYGRPRLLVFDEPNSSLDEQGERQLMATLQQLKAEGAAVVIITHRTNVLSVVDQLLILKDGTVAKVGPRDEVLAAIGVSANR